MRFITAGLLCAFFLLGVLSGQTGNGTITGVVTDPTGAVVSNAPIEVKNVETGVVFRALTTDTGNYTVPQLPIGSYELTATVQGFKKYTRQNITLAAAQVMRLDIPLEIGASTEAVTVSAESTLLKTENSELSHNVTIKQLDNLPILGVNGGGLNSSSSGFRDPYSLTQLIPGTQYTASNTLVVNGAPNNTEQIRVEGQTAGNLGGLVGFTHQTQPSVDAVQEVAVQTSNYAAEFGTVGGGIFNITMKSGTNQYHGSGYDYAVNDIMNAAQPYTGLKSAQRRHDYGGTLGGPVKIPKLYNGENKTFFFFNFEQYRENIHVNSTPATVPTAAERNGDFSQIITASGVNGVPRNVQVGGVDFVDPLGRKIQSGAIFDPTTDRNVVCGSTVSPAFTPTCVTQGLTGSIYNVRDPFVGNAVPQTSKYLDPVSQKILALIPLPTGPNAALGQLGSNYQKTWLSHRTSQIPSIKFDHQLSTKGHVSFYYGETVTESQFSFPNGNSVGLPEPIDPARGTFIYSPTIRGNYDHTLTPTLLLHFGVGYSANNFFDYAPVLDYNAQAQLGLRGATINRNFPNFGIAACNPAPPATGCPAATGGFTTLGPAGGIQSSGGTEHRPSMNFNATWVKGSHTYKAGMEARYEEYPTQTFTNAAGNYTFTNTTTGGSTSQPALTGFTTSQGSSGFGTADFLLGNVTGVTLAQPADYRNSKWQWGIFLQDTWKISRKLTLDYGVRWDYGTYAKEQYGRAADFNPLVLNSSAGNHPGGSIYEATCNCTFAGNYPYAIGPRIGIAYQINSKTVFRTGFGVVYNSTSTTGGTIVNTTTGGTPAFGGYLFKLQDGIPANIAPKFPSFDASTGLAPGAVSAPPAYLDPNAGRPARQAQWSVGLQREVSRNLVVEASYVANRGVWWPTGGILQGPEPGFNDISQDLLTKDGFTIGNAADKAILTSPWNKLNASQLSILAARGIGLPYAGYDTNQTVSRIIRAFPQYNNAVFASAAPLGKTWYDALQLTVTKRLSHGLSLNANYTYSKTLSLMSSPDVFNYGLGKNLSNQDFPHQLRLSAEYTTPKLKGNGVLGNKIVSSILSDWGMGWFVQYQSAPALALATSAGTDPISNYLGRGPGPAQLTGQPLFNNNWTDLDGVHHTDPIDINCHCYDPRTTLVLNPAAWTNVPNGQWAANQSTVIRSYRGIRYPQENVNFSRTFRMRERINLQIRAEWTNAFNRLRLPQPTATTFSSAPTQVNGIYTGGFGTITPTSGNGVTGQRSGQLIARIQF
jgi:hypothetical protein